jgi:recombination protein RecA
VPPAKKSTKKKATKKAPAVKEAKKSQDQASEFLAEMRKSGELGVAKKVEIIPTGSLVLNRAIGDGSLTGRPGGFPRGYITEILGDESTGKTTFALMASKWVVDNGGRVFWADFEHNLRAQLTYVENLGLNVNHQNFFWIEPKNFEDGVKRVGQSLFKLKPPPSLIVIDSVTAMSPKAVIDAEAGEEVQIGRHAKLTGNFLNWITKYLNQTNTGLILLNQTRVNVKTSKYDPGPAEVSSGGKAVRFFSAVRVQLKQTSMKEKVSAKSDITGATEDKFINVAVKASIIKNKFDVPYKSGPIYLAFGRGIDNVMSLVILGLNKKIFKSPKGSSWIEWEDPDGGKLSFKVQGKVALVRYLEEHPETLEALKPLLVPSKDISVMFERKNELEHIPDNDDIEVDSEDDAALAELDAIVPDEDDAKK